MYKVLIVDDEKMIRMGMSRGLPWNNMQIGEVYQAGSAMEAIEILKEKQPDIMLTDINMPGMTGLELIEKANEILPDIKILVITGYDRFDYARECLRMHVEDLFLKPIEEDVLIEKIEAIVEELKEEKRYMEYTKRRDRGNIDQLRVERSMKQLIGKEEIDQEEIQWLYNEFDINNGQEIQAAIIIPYQTDKKEKRDLYWIMSVKDICIGLVDGRGQGITFVDDEENIVVTFFNHGYVNEIYEKIEEMVNIVRDELSAAPKVVLGGAVNGLENIFVSYNDAMNLIKEGRDKASDFLQSGNTGKRSDLFNEIYEEMRSTMCMNVGNSEYVLRVFDSFTLATESYNLTEESIRRYCFDLASSIYFIYSRNAGFSGNGKLEKLMENIMFASSKNVCEVTRMFFCQIFGQEKENMNDLIINIRRYIDENLSTELSVSDIAAHFYITPNYLSKLYKKVTKEGCNEYIVRKRIEKAQYLLENTNYKTSKIADMVGYRDANYFSMAFKKYVGYSPTIYRQQLRDIAEVSESDSE